MLTRLYLTSTQIIIKLNYKNESSNDLFNGVVVYGVAIIYIYIINLLIDIIILLEWFIINNL